MESYILGSWIRSKRSLLQLLFIIYSFIKLFFETFTWKKVINFIVGPGFQAHLFTFVRLII